MKDATKAMIEREMIDRMNYVINCEDDRKIQDKARHSHYTFLDGFLTALLHSETISPEEYRHYSHMAWDMYGDRQQEAENNLTSMDCYGRIAVLSDNDNIYYYYSTEDGEVLRVSDGDEAKKNASWDMDILSEDLMKDDTQIDFLCDDIVDFILTDQEARNMYGDTYAYVANKVDGYKEEVC